MIHLKSKFCHFSWSLDVTISLVSLSLSRVDPIRVIDMPEANKTSPSWGGVWEINYINQKIWKSSTWPFGADLALANHSLAPLIESKSIYRPWDTAQTIWVCLQSSYHFHARAFWCFPNTFAFALPSLDITAWAPCCLLKWPTVSWKIWTYYI